MKNLTKLIGLPNMAKYPNWKPKETGSGIYAGKRKGGKRRGGKRTGHKKGGFLGMLAGSALGSLLPMAIDGISSLFHKKGSGMHSMAMIKRKGGKRKASKGGKRSKKGGAMVQPGPLA
jgi:hypothetical protein